MVEQIECYECHKRFLKEEFKDGLCPNCGSKSPHYYEEQDEDSCPVCHCYVEPGDIYCRYCGAKVDAEFKPYWNIMETLYGPPPVRVHLTCSICGNHWTGLEDAFEGGKHFCPKCGKKAEKGTTTPT